jgi:hypothetical protein
MMERYTCRQRRSESTMYDRMTTHCIPSLLHTAPPFLVHQLHCPTRSHHSLLPSAPRIATTARIAPVRYHQSATAASMQPQPPDHTAWSIAILLVKSTDTHCAIILTLFARPAPGSRSHTHAALRATPRRCEGASSERERSAMVLATVCDALEYRYLKGERRDSECGTMKDSGMKTHPETARSESG